jgi:hypothetical protein
MQAALLVVSSIPIQTEGGKGATVRVAPTQFFARMATQHHSAASRSGLLRLQGGWDGDGDDQDLAAAEADFEAAMNAAGSDGEGDGSSEKSAPTRSPSSAQRGGQAESGGCSREDDFAAALEAATAAKTVRKQQGRQAESGGSSGHDDFAAAEADAAQADRGYARQESRRLEARSSDSVEDDIFRSESGERGSAVTSGGPGIQAVKQAGKQAVSQALARAHAERQCPLERLVAPLCNIQI